MPGCRRLNGWDRNGRMDVAVLERMLDEAFEHAVVYHGYTTYTRDYEVNRSGIGGGSMR
ncbi:hypothetical protein GCM10027160_13110 [Streptomyces calidiresistens]